MRHYGTGRWDRAMTRQALVIPWFRTALEDKLTSMQPLLFSTLFKFLYPHKKPIRNQWDNFSSDLSTNESAHINLESCREACTANSACLQYLYRNLRCYTSATVSYGRASLRGSNGGDVRPISYVSGWVVERIEDLQRNAMCEEVKWLKPNNTRHWIG